MKALLLIYTTILASVFLLRQVDYSAFLKPSGGIIASIQENLMEASRVLSSVNEDPLRTSICLESGGTGSVSQSQKDSASTSYSMYRNIFGDPIGEPLIKGESIPSGPIVRKGIFLGIVMFFFLLTPVIMAYYCCYCCCDNKCPCCCKRDTVKEPFTRSEMLCTLIPTILYSALIFGTSIAGYVYAGKINSSYKVKADPYLWATKCTVVSTMDNLNLPQTYTTSAGATVKFSGFIQLKQDLNDVDSGITSYFNNVSTFVGTQTTNLDTIKGLDKTVADMFTVLKTSVAPAMKTHLTNEDGATNTFQHSITTSSSSSFFGDSFYIPYVQAAKSLYANVSTGAISAMSTAITQANSFVTGGNTYHTSVQAAIDQIVSGQTSISNMVSSIYKNSSNVDKVFALTTTFLMIFYGFFMVVAVAGSILSFFGFVKNWFGARKILNILWIFLGIVTFFGLAISIILIIITIMMMETCTETNKMLVDKPYLQSVGLNSDISGYLTTCLPALGGSGDILTQLGIQAKINDLTSVTQKLIDAKNAFDQTAFETFEKQINTVQNQQVVFETNGIYYSRNGDVNFVTTPANTISPNYPIIIDFSEGQALYAKQVAYIAGQSSSGGVANPYSTSTCMSTANFDQIIYYNSQCPTGANLPGTFSWASPVTGNSCLDVSTQTVTVVQADINSRYGTCNSQVAIFTDFYDKVKNYIAYMHTRYYISETFNYNTYASGTSAAVPTTFSGFRSDYVTLIVNKVSSTVAGGLGFQIINFQTDLQTNVITPSATLTSKVSGTNGIQQNVNCLFFGDSITNFNSQMCDDVAVTIFNTLKVMLISCFASFTLIILLYKMSSKLLGQFKHSNAKNPNGSTVMPGMEMQKFI